LLSIITIGLCVKTERKTKDPPSITSVSTSLTTDFSVQQGSIAGGTVLYIKGVGFDQSPDNNVIYIGTLKCPVSSKGGNQQVLTCTTPKANTSQSLVNVPVTVYVSGVKATCPSNRCLFTYISSATPQL